MKQDHTACPRGWERIWSAGPALSDFWSEPEPSVVEWARGFEPGARVLDLGCGVGRKTTCNLKHVTRGIQYG